MMLRHSFSTSWLVEHDANFSSDAGKQNSLKRNCREDFWLWPYIPSFSFGFCKKRKRWFGFIMSRKDINGKAGVTSQKNIQDAIVKYFEGNSIGK